MRILVYDPYLSTDRTSQLGVTVTTLGSVMAESANVWNHAPSAPETHHLHLIGTQQVALLRDNAIFINIGRVWTVNEEALAQAD